MLSKLLIVLLAAVAFAQDKGDERELRMTTVSEEDLKYIGFVVDDTGSMEYEIDSVRKWIEKCITGENPQCVADRFFLQTFNDPFIGNMTGPTDDIQFMLDVIRNLEVNGGGDCPELMYEGMQNAIDIVPADVKKCKIFLFTDATAKDEDKHARVLESFDEKPGCAFIPILTGCCGVCDDACESVSEEYCLNHVIDTIKKSAGSKRRKRSTEETSGIGESLLYALAESTGGTIYNVPKPITKDEGLQFLTFLEERVSLGFCPTNEIAGPLPKGYRCEEECVEKGMCWDRSVAECYCNKADSCARDKITPTKCKIANPKYKESECRPEKPVEFFEDAGSCDIFHVCVFGTRYRFKCAEGTVFNGSPKSSCDDPENVPPPCGTKYEI